MNLNPFELLKSETLPVKTEQYYGEDEPSFDLYAYSYDELLESVNPLVKWTVIGDDYNYQGDYFYFGELEDKYYYVVIGYGSCSGCDALQGCGGYLELVDLRDDIKRSIREFDSLQDFEKWFEEHLEDQWYSTDEVNNFANLFKEKYNIELKVEED